MAQQKEAEKLVQFKIPEYVLNAFDEFASDQNRTRSGALRHLIMEVVKVKKPVVVGIPGVHFIPAEMPRVKRICHFCRINHCSTCEQGSDGAVPGTCECECGGLKSLQYLNRVREAERAAASPAVVQDPYFCTPCREGFHMDCKHGQEAKGIFKAQGKLLNCRCEVCVEDRGE